MWNDLKVAVREGIVLGVKYALALAIVGGLVLWAAGDYLTLRKRVDAIDNILGGHLAWHQQTIHSQAPTGPGK